LLVALPCPPVMRSKDYQLEQTLTLTEQIAAD
jgi:hypothetical protein